MPLTFEPRVFQILTQMFVAFGQGAGDVHVSLEAIAKAADAYAPHVEKHADKWDSIALQALNYARGLGRATAHRTLSESRFVITAQDFAETDRLFRERSSRLFQECPFCPFLEGARRPGP